MWVVVVVVVVMLPEYRWRLGRVHGTCVVETVGANERTYGLQPMQGSSQWSSSCLGAASE